MSKRSALLRKAPAVGAAAVAITGFGLLTAPSAAAARFPSTT